MSCNTKSVEPVINEIRAPKRGYITGQKKVVGSIS